MPVLQAGVTHALWPIVVVASLAAVELGLRRDTEPGIVLLVAGAP